MSAPDAAEPVLGESTSASALPQPAEPLLPETPHVEDVSERAPQADPNLRAGPYDPELETLDQWNRRRFTRLLAQFDGEELHPPDWPGFDQQKLAPILLIMSIAAKLDSEGRGKPTIADGQPRRWALDGDTQYDFQVSWDGFTYYFMKGDIPLWDEWGELVKQDPQAQASFSEPEPPRTFAYPPAFFAGVSKFGHEALALLP